MRIQHYHFCIHRDPCLSSSECLSAISVQPPATENLPSVLLTGFNAFGDDRSTVQPTNASWQAVSALHGSTLVGHKIVTAQLSTVFGESTAQLMRLLHIYRPTLVICVGQAGGRAAISLESIAINWMAADLPDNAGMQPQAQPIMPTGPETYCSNLPIAEMHAALTSAGIPVEISCDAGTFVCNHVFFQLMHAMATDSSHRRLRGGFVHVPFLPDQGTPHMTLGDTVKGLQLAVTTAINAITRAGRER